ncbi:hypothetical protein RJT34_26952 [Clitoria ternatea]|uniref:Uncharacterized protein n=1 Tax=Clitoria ternatea TaxID=43366 RepID=A0AAN9F799_CLITE
MRSSKSVVHDSPTHSGTSVIENLLKSSKTPYSATHGVRSHSSLMKSLMKSTVVPDSGVISHTSVVDNFIKTTTISHPSSTTPNSATHNVRSPTSVVDDLIKTAKKGSLTFAPLVDPFSDYLKKKKIVHKTDGYGDKEGLGDETGLGAIASSSVKNARGSDNNPLANVHPV